MQPVQPHARQRRRDVQPVPMGRPSGCFRSKPPTRISSSPVTRRQHPSRTCVADADRTAVLAIPRRDHVHAAEAEIRNDEDKAEDEVPQEHQLIEVVLVDVTGGVLEERDAPQVRAVRPQQCDEAEHNEQHGLQAGSDGGDVASTRCGNGGGRGRGREGPRGSAGGGSDELMGETPEERSSVGDPETDRPGSRVNGMGEQRRGRTLEDVSDQVGQAVRR